MPARAVFFGSGSFAVPILDAAAESPEIVLAAVVTAPSRRAGRQGAPRPTPVATRAAALGLDVRTPETLRAADVVASLSWLAADLFLVADYGRLLPPAVLDLPPRGALNVHPSLLPRWRGASPIAAAILAGDRETGVTVMLMDAGLDTGPILSQRPVPLEPDATAPELEDRLARLGARLVGESLGPWLQGDLLPREQPEAEATLSRVLRRADGRLEPSRPASELARQVRAYQPWPGSFLDLADHRIAVWAAEAVPHNGDDPTQDDEAPGRLVADGPGLALVTAEGRLRLLEVQPAGGRRMSAAELRRGRPGLVGQTVGPGPAPPIGSRR